MAIETNAKQFLESLVAGDMITFHSQTATHWGIYVGDKKIVHLIGETKADSSNQSEALFTVAGEKYEKAVVNEEDFIDVAKAFDKYERNCENSPELTFPSPDDPEDIVDLAKTMVGNIYYNEMWNSCKKLAIYCRYDLEQMRDSAAYGAPLDAFGVESPVSLGAYQIPMDVAPKGAYQISMDMVHVHQDAFGVESPVLLGTEEIPMDVAPKKIPSKQQKFITQHNKEIIKELEKGDLVTFKRKWYYHWAVYIGDSKIIHLPGDEPITKAMKLIHIFSISGVPFSKGWVKVDDFWKVAFDSRADKNNKKDQLLKPKPVGEIVNTAKGMLGKIGYNILWNNCEHFASKCRYGTKRSDQVIFGVWCTIGIFAFAVLAKILQDMFNHS